MSLNRHPINPAHQPDWAQVLSQMGNAPGQRPFALVDGALNTALWDEAKRRAWSCASIYRDLPEGNAPEITPMLISLDPESNRHAERLWSRVVRARLAFAPDSALVVWSALDLDDLARFLGQFAVIELHDERRALLRFHDPRILHAALAVQSEEEHAYFFSAVSSLWAPDIDEHWWRYQSDGDGAAHELPEQPAWTEAREVQFADLLMPRKILDALIEQQPAKVSGPGAPWLERIEQWLAHARTLGAQSENDGLMYCIAALNCGDNFTAHPDVADHLSPSPELGPNCFANAMLAIPDEVWARLEYEHAQRESAMQISA